MICKDLSQNRIIFAQNFCQITECNFPEICNRCRFQFYFFQTASVLRLNRTSHAVEASKQPTLWEFRSHEVRENSKRWGSVFFYRKWLNEPRFAWVREFKGDRNCAIIDLGKMYEYALASHMKSTCK